MKTAFIFIAFTTLFVGCRSANTDSVNYSHNPSDAQFFQPKKKRTLFEPPSTRESLPADAPQTTSGERWRTETLGR